MHGRLFGWFVLVVRFAVVFALLVALVFLRNFIVNRVDWHVQFGFVIHFEHLTPLVRLDVLVVGGLLARLWRGVVVDRWGTGPLALTAEYLVQQYFVVVITVHWRQSARHHVAMVVRGTWCTGHHLIIGSLVFIGYFVIGKVRLVVGARSGGYVNWQWGRYRGGSSCGRFLGVPIARRMFLFGNVHVIVEAQLGTVLGFRKSRINTADSWCGHCCGRRC